VIKHQYNEADQLVKTESFRHLPLYSEHLLDQETKSLKEHDRQDHLWFDDLWNHPWGLGFLSPVEISYQYDANGNLTQKSWKDHDKSYSRQYRYDDLGRLTEIETPWGSKSNYSYDALDRRVFTAQSGDHVHGYQIRSMYDRRQEVGQWEPDGTPYRRLTYLPLEDQGLPYGELIHQNLYETDRRKEFNPYGHFKSHYSSLWFHQDSLGSTRELTDDRGRSIINYGYNPQGEVYTYRSHGIWSGLGRSILAKHLNRTVNPYLYTGKHTDSLTGLVQMDARFYDPKTSRFIQPDVFNFANLALPQNSRHELLQYLGLQTEDLLVDPAQQLRYGYASGNPLRWVDPMGLIGESTIVNIVSWLVSGETADSHVEKALFGASTDLSRPASSATVTASGIVSAAVSVGMAAFTGGTNLVASAIAGFLSGTVFDTAVRGITSNAKGIMDSITGAWDSVTSAVSDFFSGSSSSVPDTAAMCK